MHLDASEKGSINWLNKGAQTKQYACIYSPVSPLLGPSETNNIKPSQTIVLFPRFVDVH